MQWQPIETAPRDGTSILLYVVTPPGDEYAVEVGQPEGWAYINIGEWDEGCSTPPFEREPGWATEHAGEPTHWMPLPAPPFVAGLAPATGHETQHKTP